MQIQPQNLNNPLPAFQTRVASCMLGLGNAQNLQNYVNQSKLPIKENDYILGEEMYISHVRPFCVDRGYVWGKRMELGDLEADGLKEFGGFVDRERKKEEMVLEEMEDEERMDQFVEAKRFKPCGKLYDELNSNNSKKQNDTEKSPHPQPPKKPPKKGSKAYQKQTQDRKLTLHRSSFNDKFFSDLDLILASQKRQNFQTEFTLKNKIIEIKLSGFLYMRWFVDQWWAKGKLGMEEVYEIISMMRRVVGIFQGWKGPKYPTATLQNKQQPITMIEVSPTLILDLKICVAHLITTYNFSNIEIIFNYPRLAYDNKYSKYFPCFDISAYGSQIELVQQVSEAINNKDDMKKKDAPVLGQSKVIMYNTMIGAGKTSVVLALAALVARGSKKLRLVYACQLKSVGSQLMRLCYKNDIPFSIATHKKIPKPTKTHIFPYISHKFAPSQTTTKLIFADWQTAYHMFDRHEYTEQEMKIFENQVIQDKMKMKNGMKIVRVDPEDTILFVDQPVYDCNSGNSEKTGALFTIFANRPPKVIILASATLPHISQLPKTHTLLTQHHPDLTVSSIKSKQFQIGCQFSTFQGQVYYPHTGCTSRLQLLNIVARIQENPFLMRLYTGTSLCILVQVLRKKGIEVEQGLGIYDDRVEVDFRKFPQCAVKILSQLAKCDHDTIRDVCSLGEETIDYNPTFEQKQDSLDQIFANLKPNPTTPKNQPYIKFPTMLTTDAYKYLGGCLIATLDPISFVYTHFKYWVRSLPSIQHLSNQYEENYCDVQDQMRLILGGGSGSGRMGRRKENGVFGADLRVNTLHHYWKYYSNPYLTKMQERLFQSKLINSVPVLETLDYFSKNQVEQTLLKLLLCGIGVYTTSGLPQKYLAKVQQLASMNMLAFIVCDRALCCGVNFSISNVILLDDLADTLDFKQIFQLVGRAGRVGRSWTARAFLQEGTQKRLFEFVKRKEEDGGNDVVMFEGLAEWHLGNPELKLRTQSSQICYEQRFPNEEQQRIHIILKNNQTIPQLNPKIKQVCLFIQNQQQILTTRIPYRLTSKINRKMVSKHFYHNFPASPIFETDISTKNRDDGLKILDVKGYYMDEEGFIGQVLQNVAKRILRMYFKDKKEQGFKFVNNFLMNNYREYFSPQTNTFTFVIDAPCQCPPVQDNSITYSFNPIIYRPLDPENPQYQPKPQTTQKLTLLLSQCQNMWTQLHRNPNSLLLIDIKTIRSLTLAIQTSRSFVFFNDLYNAQKTQIDQYYLQLTQNIEHRQSLLYEKQSKYIIFCGLMEMKGFWSHGNSGTDADQWYIDGKVKGVRKIEDLVDGVRVVQEREVVEEDVEIQQEEQQIVEEKQEKQQKQEEQQEVYQFQLFMRQYQEQQRQKELLQAQSPGQTEPQAEQNPHQAQQVQEVQQQQATQQEPLHIQAQNDDGSYQDQDYNQQQGEFSQEEDDEEYEQDEDEEIDLDERRKQSGRRH